MGLFRRLLGGQASDDRPIKPQRLDYLNEALALERQGDYDAAITSYRLALRDHPNEPRILQNLAIAFSRTGKVDDAIRHYRKALEADATLAGAHYGLAFLLMKRGDLEGAAQHLKAFLGNPPRGVDAQKWIGHAEQTLAELGSPAAPQRTVGLEGA
ncbi:MAG TPA: tetratricopeptide repeat protein [Gemmatimonadales bacterium]|nr:tetratricopeptide repeat protein [Gemmatimonadales bacterium]